MDAVRLADTVGLRRMLVFALLCETAFAMVNISAMPVFLTHSRALHAGSAGAVLAVFLATEALAKGPMGRLSDRIGRRPLLVAGPLLAACSALGTVAIPQGGAEVAWFMALRILDGVGAGMIWPAIFAMMGDVAGEGRRQRAMSVLNLCYLGGLGLALPLGGWANEHLSPLLHLPAKTGSFWLAAALFALAFAVAVWLKESHTSRQQEGAQFDVGAWRRIPGPMVIAVVTFVGIGLPMAIVKLFASDVFRLSEVQFGLLVVPGVLAMASLSVPMARLGERLGSQRAVVAGLFSCLVGVVGLWASSLFLVRDGTTWSVTSEAVSILALGAGLTGLGFLLALPAWYTAVSELDPARRGANTGAIMAAQGLGAIIGTALGSALYGSDEHLGTLGAKYAPFAGCALCVGAGWLLSLVLIPPRGRGSRSPIA